MRKVKSSLREKSFRYWNKRHTETLFWIYARDDRSRKYWRLSFLGPYTSSESAIKAFSRYISDPSNRPACKEHYKIVQEQTTLLPGHSIVVFPDKEESF